MNDNGGNVPVIHYVPSGTDLHPLCGATGSIESSGWLTSSVTCERCRVYLDAMARDADEQGQLQYIEDQHALRESGGSDFFDLMEA